jgi:hypothetical protein
MGVFAAFCSAYDVAAGIGTGYASSSVEERPRAPLGIHES